MSTTIGSGKALDLHYRMRVRGFDLYGNDDAARYIPPIQSKILPAASAAYALECLKTLHTMLGVALEHLLDEASNELASYDGKMVVCATLVRDAANSLKAGNLPSDLEDKAKAVANCSNSAAEGLRDLYDAYVAIKAGAFSSRQSSNGYRIMDAVDNRLFWDASEGVAKTINAAAMAVTSDEKWAAFKEGAKEAATALAEKAGNAAGAVVAVAGQAVGAGVGSFFDELGLVKGVILAAGGYVAWRVL